MAPLVRSSRSKPLTLAERALGDLRDAILNVEQAPGAVLRLDALQQQYGLSSSPLREALNRLVSEGLVTQDSNRGFRVAEVSIADFRELTEIRLLIEPDALRASIRHGDDAWEGRVVATHHQLRSAEQDQALVNPVLDANWSAAHRAFHLELFSGGPSKRLRRQCAQLFSEAERYRRLTARLRRTPRNKGVEHEDIMTATLDRDVERASGLLRDHIWSGAETLTKALMDGEGATPGTGLRSAA